MQDIVCSYLTKHYEIATSEVGNDGIYLKSDTNKHRIPVYGDKLLKELIIIFSLEDDLLKSYTDTWAISIKSDINLEFYWKTQEEFTFPHVSRVISSLISNGLVPVQPMSSPNPQSLFLDYQYSGNTPNGNGRVYERQVMDDVVARWEIVLNHPNIFPDFIVD